MRIFALAVPALLLAGATAAQDAVRSNPLDPLAKVPSLEFRSAFEDYRPFVEGKRRDWREANDEVRAAGGHAGQRPGQGTGEQSSKPRPGNPESSGHQDHHK